MRLASGDVDTYCQVLDTVTQRILWYLPYLLDLYLPCLLYIYIFASKSILSLPATKSDAAQSAVILLYCTVLYCTVLVHQEELG